MLLLPAVCGVAMRVSLGTYPCLTLLCCDSLKLVLWRLLPCAVEVTDML
jgi:hypothetical protein